MLGNGKQGGTTSGRVPFARSDVHKLNVSADSLGSSTMLKQRRPNELWPSMELSGEKCLRGNVSEQTESKKPGDNLVAGKRILVRWNEMNRVTNMNVNLAWSSGRYARTTTFLKVSQLAATDGKSSSSTVQSNRINERSESASKVSSRSRGVRPLSSSSPFQRHPTAAATANSLSRLSSRSLSPSPFLSRARTPPTAPLKTLTQPDSRAPSSAKVSGRTRPTYVTQLDGVQSLKILHNRYLQWRFINARFQSAFKRNELSAKRLMFNVSLHVFDLQASVAQRKRSLDHAVQRNKLASLLDSHAQGLEQWSFLGGRHVGVLSEMIQALNNTMARLPLCNGSKGDPREIFRELQRTRQVIASIEELACMLLPNVKEEGQLMLELAQIVSDQKALIRECAYLIDMVTRLEIEERSLRVQLIQALY